DTWPGSLAAPQSLDRYVYVENNPTTYADPSGNFVPLLIIGAAALVGAAAGGVAYTAGVGIANVAQGRPIGDGWNLVDAGISAVAGATSGVLATTGVGLGGLVVMNAVVGFDATAASMIAGGRRDPSELIAGTAFGALGPLLPGGSGATGFLRGLVSSSVANAAQGILTSEGLNVGPFALVSKSRALTGSRGR
ncbi:MAG: hypothetical protein C0498_14170, partial [Anaerolinea sp.]|nr:hypothetical protein [Anaerolinea sp.]